LFDANLVSTVGTNCGVAQNNASCRIRGVVFCGTPQPSITMSLPMTALTTDICTFGWPNNHDDDNDFDPPRARRATTVGPLFANAPTPGQDDGYGGTFSGVRFELSRAVQVSL